MRKIKVLHYAPGFEIGGIESRLIDWYTNIDRDKIEFSIVRLNNKPSDKVNEFIALGGKMYNLPAFSFKNMVPYFKGLKKTLKTEHPDIVHVHCLSSGVFCLFLAKTMGIKTRILHSRTTDFLPKERNIFVKKILKKLAPYFATDYFACSCEAGIWGIGKKREGQVRVIKNGIELPKFIFNKHGRDKIRKELKIENKTVIGTIGRLSPQKNLFFLIDIFKEVVSQDNNDSYRLVLVGDGPLRNSLEAYIKDMNLDGKVIITGAKQEVWNYYMAFDIFVGASLYEGFGTTAIEAQATGVPTILSTGFPEVVAISDFIERIPVNTPDEWVTAIRCIKDRKRTSSDAKNVEAKGYNAKVIAKDLEKFYLRANDYAMQN